MNKRKSKMFTEKEVIEAITNQYIKDFGSMNHKNQEGYFITGFVGVSLKNEIKKRELDKVRYS